MDHWLFYPPVLFLIVLISVLLLVKLCSLLAFKSKDKQAGGTCKGYACGEDVPDNLAQPDYSQFFPFAFFFTIAHVATLIITTVPAGNMETMFMAIMYLSVVVVGLIVLFRR